MDGGESVFIVGCTNSIEQVPEPTINDLNGFFSRFQGKQKTRYDPWEVARKKLILVANNSPWESPVNPGKKSWLSTGSNYPGKLRRPQKRR